MSPIKYVGLDVHKAITVIVVLDERGQFESRSQIKTNAEPLGDFFRGLSGKVELVSKQIKGSSLPKSLQLPYSLARPKNCTSTLKTRNH